MWGTDLFSAEYVQGDLASSGLISALTHYIGIVAVFIISIVGFGIVMSSIMKNAMAGLYCVNPKLWDRVAEVKENGGNRATEAIGKFGAVGKVASKPVGLLISGFCAVLPNVKAMTDFDDNDTLDAKAYFLRALPLMIFQIFVGVFIFYGYPSKVAAYAGDFGTGLFDVVLTNVDPTAWVEAVPTTFANYTLVTDGATDDESKAVNKVSYAVIKRYVAKYNDITKSKRVEIGLDIESWVMTEMTSMENAGRYLDSSAYDMSVECLIPGVPQDLSRVNQADTSGAYSRPKVGGTGIVTYSFVGDASMFDSGTAMDNSNDYVRVNLVFTPIAQKVDSSNIKSVVHVNSKTKDSINEVQIKLANSSTINGWTVRTSGKSAVGTAVVGDKSVKVTISVVGGTLVVTPQSKSDSISGLSEITGISGLKYANGTTVSHSITGVTVDTSVNVVTFMPEISDMFNTWTYGEAPAKKEADTGSSGNSAESGGITGGAN